MCAAAEVAAREEWWWGRGRVEIGGGFSHESEHDLAVMVSDFLENGGGSSGADSWCSSDSDSGVPDLPLLADKISRYKNSLATHENELLLVVQSMLLSMKESDLSAFESGPCSFSCIRFPLVKLLRLSGYDAAVCAARWQGAGKVPGGDHEYIDVVNIGDAGGSERVIIDIDFRSHFEIARAVHSYDRILKLLPAVFVGSLSQLKLYLEVMAEAAKSSLRQNSMPIPPWRSLAYLQAKWNSPYQRLFGPEERNFSMTKFSNHKQCSGLLKRLQYSLHFEKEEERYLKPINGEGNRRKKFEGRKHSLLRTH